MLVSVVNAIIFMFGYLFLCVLLLGFVIVFYYCFLYVIIVLYMRVSKN